MRAALGKELVGGEALAPEQIRLILDTAEPFKEVSERPIKKVPALRGKTIANLFFEASTRTRISFAFAEKRLSADTVNVAASGSSVSKGGPLVDTAKNLAAMRIEEAIEWADVLNILRLQLERMEKGFIPSLREYFRVFGVTQERLDRARRPLVIMHPGPMNRGVEIESRVADGPHSVILDQVTNGVAVRVAVLFLPGRGKPQPGGPGQSR